jgi:hypothetical protein
MTLSWVVELVVEVRRESSKCFGVHFGKSKFVCVLKRANHEGYLWPKLLPPPPKISEFLLHTSL